MDNNETYREIELNYRKLYGRIFSGLISLFGSRYVELIEDAIQNAFYKSLKSWKPGKVPAKPLEWLFVVSKNEVLTQLRRNQKVVSLVQTEDLEENVSNYTTSDLRLEVLIIIAELEDLSTKTKILFILKNLFGLSIPEIHQSTLLGEEAIYKSIQRAKIKILPLDFKKEIYSFQIHENSRSVIHEILYSVFNAGF
ncbi:MAG: hypothetical protein KDC53_20145, partial [Saprospiraceae bacterium]|nr:hypothetical protein [Saprospiraceae bacterium]